MFSRSAGYAMQALIYLSEQPPGQLTGAREIAAASQIPIPFLWKILRNLSQKRLLRSFKGVRGGYELARPPGKITIAQVLNATQGSDLLDACVLLHAACDERNPCPLHSFWQDSKKQLERFVQRTTLADVARIAASPRPKRG
jgi:Rrf2 family protein